MVAGVINLSGLIVGMVVTSTAPTGYQDEKGFHLGAQFSGASAVSLGNLESEAWQSQFPVDEPQYVCVEQRI